jgi:hypothetical protein
MTFHSALEDLRITTLDSFSGSLRKLEYLAGLRTVQGTYTHWGLARLHGDLAARKALEQEHRLVVSLVLATPLQLLLEDVDQSSRSQQLTPLQFLAKLKSEPGLLPPNAGVGSAEHLSSVLDALSSLVHHRLGATHLVS